MFNLDFLKSIFHRQIKISNNWDTEYYTQIDNFLTKYLNADQVDKTIPEPEMVFVTYKITDQKLTLFFEGMDGTSILANKRILKKTITQIYKQKRELLDENLDWEKYLN